MSMETGTLNNVTHLIQLAVAPIFLLTGVATTLMVLTNRLARIVDRGRVLEARSPADKSELLVVERRARLIYRALSLGVFSAILVCLVMTLAFVGEIFRFNVAAAIAVLFMTSLFSYTGTLVCLLREVFLALGSFSLGIHSAQKGRPQ